MFALSPRHSEQMRLKWVNPINSAKNLCDEGATNDIVIGRFLEAQEITHLSWLLPQAAKILRIKIQRSQFYTYAQDDTVSANMVR